VPASDPMRERIEAFNQAHGGGVTVHKAGRGYSLLSESTGTPIARLKPTGDADKVQVLWWNGQRWGASGPFGIATTLRANDDETSSPREFSLEGAEG